jgi:hypothetical protein
MEKHTENKPTINWSTILTAICLAMIMSAGTSVLQGFQSTKTEKELMENRQDIKQHEDRMNKQDLLNAETKFKIDYIFGWIKEQKEKKK